MLRRVRFIVFGKPQSQEQARACPVMRTLPNGRKVPVLRMTPEGNQVPVMVFPNPKKTTNWRSDVKLASLNAMKAAGFEGLMLEGPLSMMVEIYLERPKYLCTPKEMRANPYIRFAPRSPDCSNIAKTTEDALQKLIFNNDAQIVEISYRKFYCAAPGHGDVRPRVEVLIQEVADGVVVSEVDGAGPRNGGAKARVEMPQGRMGL